jgi:hypothetical protein
VTELPIDYIVVAAIAAAWIAYIVILKKLLKSKNKTEIQPVEAGSSQPPPFSSLPELPYEQTENSVERDVVVEERPLSFDDLLSQTIKFRFKQGSLEVNPSIHLENEGDYKILGKEWKGKVRLRIRPKRVKPVEQKPPEQKTLEEYAGGEEESEESLF